MADLDLIVQPEDYRIAAPPAWAFFPNLRLLFGWGDGLWETLGARMAAVRTMFVIARAAADLDVERIDAFLEWRAIHDEDRPPMPFFARTLYAFDRRCTVQAANDVCRTYAGPAIHSAHGEDAHHPLEANEHYRVGHGVSARDGSVFLALEKRSKTLKPELSAKMKEIAYRRAFIADIDRLKDDHRAFRVPQLLADPGSRPAFFYVEMALQERIRHEEVCRGKLNSQGVPHRPYTGQELLSRTAHSVADREATDLTFDYRWTPILRFGNDGLTRL